MQTFTITLVAVVSNSGKGARFLLAIGLWLACGLSAVRGQSALDGFDPNADGNIRTVVVQPDGKILIGGDFTMLSPNGGTPVMRNRIARLNPDGTLDTVFNPNASGTVSSIALQADGKILVGGDFTGANSIGGETRNRIARLDATTGLADSFDPNANLDVRAIAVQPDGKILVGGNFFGANSIGGQLRNRIARLDPVTGQADSFDPNADLAVNSIVVQPDGKIVAGGQFTNIGGQPRNRIARLDSMTGLADSFDPNASGEVKSIAVQADGRILAGGQFNNIGGQTRNYIARLDRATGLADSFDPNASNPVYSLAVQSDRKILVGGVFFSIGGQTRSALARLNPTTGLADAFDPSVDGVDVPIVYAIAVQADGKILTGGFFTNFAPNGGAPVPRNRIARLEIDGRLDQTLNLNLVGDYVLATAVQADGKILIGGSFTSVLGVTRNNIARLNTDGTLDTAFNPNASSGVNSIAVQADGRIVVGGAFTSIGGQTRNKIARLDPNTGLADSFNPNADGSVLAIAVQADGRILVGGQFGLIGGQPRNNIARLDPTTGLADPFNPDANDLVLSIAVQTDGRILVGGNFRSSFGSNSIGGQPRNGIARLDPVTGLADSFNPNPNDLVYSVAVQADGKILIGGIFTRVRSVTRNHIARLDPTTGLPDSFNPNADHDVFSIAVQADGKILAAGQFGGIGGQPRNGIARLIPTTGLADSFNPNANDFVLSIAVQADGKILAGGGFTSIGGETRNRFARLTNDTAALQNLEVTPTTVTWTRGGSSPLLGRVTFESSPDNVNFTALGDGMVSGSTWTLTGLSLPVSQNLYVRARGYYRSGYQAASESITESVWNVFLLPPPTPTAVVSRKLHGGAPFDIGLPLSGTPGIECRSGGVTNDYQVVFTFPSAVTFSGAAVTAGAGAVGSTTGGGTTEVTVNLTGLTNAQTLTITLQGVSDGSATGDVAVPMGLLIGDTNGGGTVNSGDAVQTRSRSGQPTSASNFRSDVNADGFVNSGDALAVRSQSGTSLP